MPPVLSVRDLRTRFETAAGVARVVDGVSFDIAAGEILALVGESGAGKSTVALSVMGLVDPPGRVASGRVLLGGEDVAGLGERGLRRLRGRRMAMVFQDPAAALNPVMSVGAQMVEAVLAHERMPRAAARDRSAEALARAGVPAPRERLDAYPHQLSGGLRQRVAIAIALLHRPEVILADEPTTALDVTVQAGIAEEMRRLCREAGTAMLWITHDLPLVWGLADRVAVMYAGRIVETGPAAEVLGTPRHPYTGGLVGAVPVPGRRGLPLARIPGAAPSPLALPEGCAFRPRCPRASRACLAEPDLPEGPGHAWRCHHPLGADP
jgi:peptide/nickel transport system ATP-binding protein